MTTQLLTQLEKNLLSITDLNFSNYYIEVQTADKMWAGTDDTVKMSLSGMVQGHLASAVDE